MDIRRFRSREYPYAEKHEQLNLDARVVSDRLAQILAQYPAFLAEISGNKKAMTTILAGTYEGPLNDLLAQLVTEMEIAGRLNIAACRQIKGLNEGFRVMVNPLGFPVKAVTYKSDPNQPEQGLLF